MRVSKRYIFLSEDDMRLDEDIISRLPRFEIVVSFEVFFFSDELVYLRDFPIGE